MSFLDGIDSFVRASESLARHTWFQLGGAAEYFAEPRSTEELATLLARCRQEDMKVRLLGGGSNVLVSDDGVPGVVIRLSDPHFAKIAVQGDRVTAGGAAKLGHVLSSSVSHGLAGMETLVGIPGSIGGALHNNAGSRGGDIGQWTHSAKVMTYAGEIIDRPRNELVFAYRQSSLDELVILEAEFELERDDPIELTKRMQKQWIQIKAAQPPGDQHAECIFKNPRGMSAGMLIDQCGLKGTRVGGAEVSDRHANFIIAHPGASSRDVQTLIDQIRERVSERMGVELEPQIEIWE